MIRTAMLSLLAVALLTACSSGSNNDNATSNSGNNAADVGNNSNVDVDNTGIPYATEYEFIFDSLSFDNVPGSKLNMLLAANLDLNLEYPIIVLIRLTEIDPEAGTFVLEGGSGLKTAEMGTFIFDPDSESMGTPGTLDTSSGAFTADVEYFGFVATFVFETDVTKVVLPINQLTLAGSMVLSEDGSTADIANGTLAGYMTKADGDSTMITLTAGGDPISITFLFKEETLNYDSTTGTMVDPGTGDAWYLAGKYTGIHTEISE